MHRHLASLLAAASLVCLSWAATVPDAAKVRPALSRRASSGCTGTPPSKDPWYTSPQVGLEMLAPGTLIRARQAPDCLVSAFNGTVSAIWNLMYRTTDSAYNATYAVTTLVVPSAVNDASSSFGESPLLSYQLPYDSASVDASPSYTLYGAVSDYASRLTTLLTQGCFVNIPDFEGPLAAFTAGTMSGHAVLDSVRAALDFARGHYAMSETSRYAMWGYSGGALGSEWAAELAVQYAPELDFAGAALGGLTPNVTSVVRAVSGQAYAGLGVTGALGLTAQFPAARAALVARISNETDRALFLRGLNMTSTQALVAFQGRDLDAFFGAGLAGLHSGEFLRLIDRDATMGYHGVPQMPLYVYKAVGDEISPVADTDALVDRFCGVGANILYSRNSVGGHVAEEVNGAEGALRFLAAALGGPGVFALAYNTTGCTVRNEAVGNDTSPY